MSKRKFKSLKYPSLFSDRPLRQFRQPFSDRYFLQRRAYVNPRSLSRQREFADERTFWWVVAFGVMIGLLFLADTRTTIETFGVFAIFASINVMWILVMGTAGIFSLGTLAIVGTGGFLGGKFALEFGTPWWSMVIVGSLVGLAVGLIIGLPAQRLDGMYYALLTLGLVEVARTYFRQSAAFGSASGGLVGLPTFIGDDDLFTLSGLRIKVLAAFVVLGLSLVLHRLIAGRRLGLLLKTTRDSEAFGDAIGVDLTRVRLGLFVLSSAALGAIGGFMGAFNQTVAPSIFNLDQLLLLFAMIVIGGMNSAEGVVLGTGLVVYIQRELVDWGPPRIIAIGLVAIVISLFTKNGLHGLPQQYRNWRDKAKSERIAAKSTSHGDLTPEEAALLTNKEAVASGRFEGEYRPALRALVTDEIVAEHERMPIGQHSADLERLLNYFRKGELPEKYAILAVVPHEQFRLVALSGHRGIPPREVDDQIFTTLDQAYHAVFLRRLQDLVES